jgi:hypothetical protein
MLGDLLTTRSVSLLDIDANEVLARWETGLRANNPYTISHKELVAAFRDRTKLSAAITASEEDLKRDDPVLFEFMPPHQRALVKRRLVRAHYLHTLQARMDKIEFRLDGLKRNVGRCRYYEWMLDKLENKPALGMPVIPEAQLRDASAVSEKPLALFGMVVLAPVVAKKMLDLCAGKTGLIKSTIMDIDRKDTYLGWSRTFTLSVMNLLPQYAVHDAQSASFLRDVGFYSGQMNCLVGMTLMGIELFLLTKNSLAGAWVTRNRALKISVWEQFTTQVQQRKFALLNWLFLTTLYMVSFLYWMGMAPVWPWGLLVSVGFRLVQLALFSFRQNEELTVYRASLQQIQDEMMKLRKKQASLKKQWEPMDDGADKQALQDQHQVLEKELQALVQAQNQLITKQRYKTIEFQYLMMSTLGMLTGAALLSVLIFPPGLVVPAVALVIGLVGASICLATIVIHTAVRGRLDYVKTEEAQASVKVQLSTYFNRFNQLKGDSPSIQMQRKQLFLEMKLLTTQSKYNLQLIQHQKMALTVSVLRDTLMPAGILLGVLLAPSGVGIVVIVAAMLLHLFLKKLVDMQAPKMFKDVKFDLAEYEAFAARPQLEKLHEKEMQKTNPYHFFKSNPPNHAPGHPDKKEKLTSMDDYEPEI